MLGSRVGWTPARKERTNDLEWPSRSFSPTIILLKSDFSYCSCAEVDKISTDVAHCVVNSETTESLAWHIAWSTLRQLSLSCGLIKWTTKASHSICSIYLSLPMRFCSRFQMSLNSWQNDDHRPKKCSGLTSRSPDLGLTQKYDTHSTYLWHTHRQTHTHTDTHTQTLHRHLPRSACN